MLNKYLFTLMILFLVQYSFAQDAENNTTDQFIITGKVKQEKTINIADIQR